MSNSEQRNLATEKNYERDTRKNEQNGGEVLSSGFSGGGSRDWADVLSEIMRADMLLAL